MAWQKRRGYERRAERKGKEKRNESDKGISLCSLQIPLFCQSGELDLLKKPNAKVAKNGLNSSDEEEISVETWKIKGSLIQTEGGEARGAPYLATNYTWSKKREEEEIKTKAPL